MSGSDSGRESHTSILDVEEGTILCLDKEVWKKF